MIPPRVVVDERERQSGVPEALSKLNVRVYFSRLRVADYVISPEIAVERKALPDFVSSVYDGRLFVQASEISSSYRKPYLIVEGDIKELANLTRNVNSYYGASRLGHARVRPQGTSTRPTSARPPPPSPPSSSTAGRVRSPRAPISAAPKGERTSPSSSSIWCPRSPGLASSWPEGCSPGSAPRGRS